MNQGVHGFPAHRPAPGLPAIRALAKFDGTAPAGGAGFQIEAPALKLLYNVSKIVYNGTGDYTIHFTDPFETPHFVTMAMSKEGANQTLTIVDPSDAGLATQKRIQVVDTANTPRNSAEVNVVFIG